MTRKKTRNEAFFLGVKACGAKKMRACPAAAILPSRMRAIWVRLAA